jgi:dGTPase
MVLDIIGQSWAVGNEKSGDSTIGMSAPVREATDALRDFLFERVYNPNDDREETKKARETVRFLYGYFRDNAEKLPPEYRLYSDDPDQRVVDYISGMTDQFATELAGELRW